jgi:hypothetical protein
MSETINASTVNTILNLDPAIAAATMEKLIDLAINTLNLFGADLDNMTGTEGSKSTTVTSKEAGAIYITVRAIKYGFYDSIKDGSVAGMTISVTDLASNAEVLKTIKEAALMLQKVTQKTSGIPFVVASDDS